jgi:hypothetical protein
MKSKWIAVIVFWFLLILSITWSEHHQWIDRVWAIALWIVVSATIAYFLSSSTRRSDGNRGYPHWFTRFAYDEDRQKKRRNSDVESD